MTMSDDDLTAERGGRFMRFAATVGDLSNPFYAEERQRDVWNEASAVGFQVMLWLGMIAATVMIWLGRGSAVPYAVGVFVVLGIASSIALGYARRLSVDVDATLRLWRWTTVLYAVLMLLFFLGVARAAVDAPIPSSVLIGFATGGLLTMAWAAVRLVRQRHRAPDEKTLRD